MYIKINGSNEHFDAYITTFSTQHGNNGVRVIGDMPQTDKGFKLYNDADEMVNDLSDYIYLYGDNGNEYTDIEETIEYAECSFEPLPPSGYDVLNNRISKVNSKVNTITPFTQNKKVYIGDKEVIFTNIYKQGNISAYLTIGGVQMPCEVMSEENNIIVTFDEAEEVGEVTISIQ